METRFYLFFQASDEKFKSYYVVWKQELDGLEQIICDEFKSYYVVWKPAVQKTAQRRPSGLNRTMQYGNEALYGSHWHDVWV